MIKLNPTHFNLCFVKKPKNLGTLFKLKYLLFVELPESQNNPDADWNCRLTYLKIGYLDALVQLRKQSRTWQGYLELSGLWNILKFNFFPFFKVYLFILREREQGRDRERDRQNPKQAPCCPLWTPQGPWTHELWYHDLSQNQESDA